MRVEAIVLPTPTPSAAPACQHQIQTKAEPHWFNDPHVVGAVVIVALLLSVTYVALMLLAMWKEVRR